MNKTFRIQCTIDVSGEYSSLGALETLTNLISEDGDSWAVDNLQVINVKELIEEEI